jgi:hypothetical protein
MRFERGFFGGFFKGFTGGCTWPLCQLIPFSKCVCGYGKRAAFWLALWPIEARHGIRKTFS